jgi:hypothetical protein
MQLSIDLISDYIMADAQDDILDISGLDEATLGSTDLLLICQSGVAKQAALEDLRADVHDAFTAYTAGLDALSTVLDEDYLYILNGGVPKKVAVSDLSNKIVGDSADPRWSIISASKYTTTPPNTYQITMSDTSDFLVGLPVKYTYASTTYYGIVTAISSNASITIAGATLNIGQVLTELAVGNPEMVVQLDAQVAGVWDGSVQNLLSTAGMYCKWGRGAACLVTFSATQGTADTGAAEGKVNVKINSNAVSTADSNKGIQVSATPGTWTDNSAIAISTSNYAITRGQAIEVACTEAGTNGDAEDLNVSMTFVLK